MSDDKEAALESAARKLRTSVEIKVAGLNPTEVSELTGRIPDLRTLLQYRDDREAFFAQFSGRAKLDALTTYSDALFQRVYKNSDFWHDHRTQLSSFFRKEIERVCRIRQIVSNRYAAVEPDSECLCAFSVFMESMSGYLLACEEGLARLGVTGSISSTSSDYLIEMNSRSYSRRRLAFMQSFFEQLRKFPVTQRQAIFQQFFDGVRQSLEADSQQRVVPLLETERKPVNMELLRLSARFGLDQDLEIDDGQRFLYFADKALEDLWPLLNVFEFPRKAIATPEIKRNPPLSEFTQRTLLELDTRQDLRLVQVFANLVSWRDDEVKQSFRETAQFYNTHVGNQVRGQSTSYAQNKPLIPTHHLLAWHELRFLHSKFLACSILSQLNYFEWIGHRLTTGTEVTFICRHSAHFREFFEIRDESGPFLYESAWTKYTELISDIIGVGSSCFVPERSEPKTRETDQTEIVDRNAIAENFLEYEFRFMNAKRGVLQPLLEAFEHSPTDDLKKLIFEVMREKPPFNRPVYHSYDEPYKVAISVMSKKAAILRTLLNLQVQHERHVGTQAADLVPLFDRPIVRKMKCTKRPYDESLFLTPFEVYESLARIGKFVTLIPKIARDLCEAIDVKFLKFGIYMEESILMEAEKILLKSIQTGLFPYDRCSFSFGYLLSDSVNAVFTSPYVNRIEPICSIMESMNEGRKLRFVLSARRFLHLTWKLQTEILGTNDLQIAYSEQCGHLGVSDRGVLMSPFRAPVTTKKEQIEYHSTTTTADKIIDWALTEFEPTAINFSSVIKVKEIIFSGSYDKLNQLLKFQRLQNAILEIALRFNSMMSDSDFLVNYFGFKRKEDEAALFLTNATERVSEEKPTDQSLYFKQFLASQMFYQSTAILRDNETARHDTGLFTIAIKTVKMQGRSFLAGHLKQKEAIDIEEMMSCYVREMIDSFAPFAYRVEIARICSLERQFLQCNSALDVFILGPDSASCLVNEAGRFEKLWFIPSWVDCVKMLQTAQLQRQGVILKAVHHFVARRYQYMAFIRFEFGLGLMRNAIFRSLYEQTFQMDFTALKALFTEVSDLVGFRELEVSLTHLEMRLLHQYLRLENSLFEALQQSYIDTTRKVGLTAQCMSLVDFWVRTHDRPVPVKALMTYDRYIPVWQEEFYSLGHPLDRGYMRGCFATTDEQLEAALKVIKMNEAATLPAILSSLNNYLSDAIVLFHLKCAYMLLLARVSEFDVSKESSILLMMQTVYLDGSSVWDNIVMRIAEDKCNPPGEDPFRHLTNAPAPVIKMQQCILETVRQQMEQILIANQAQRLQGLLPKFMASTSSQSGVEHLLLALRPEYGKAGVLGRQSDHLLELPPNAADNQFRQEHRYVAAKFINLIYNALDSCTLERRDHDGTFSTIFQAERFEENCLKLSTALHVFSHGSVSDLNSTWKEYLVTMRGQTNQSEERMKLVKRLGSFTHCRFQRQTELETLVRFQDEFIRLCSLRARYHEKMRARLPMDAGIDVDIRHEFLELLNDLTLLKSRRQLMFGDIRRNVIGSVARKIQVAKEVILQVDRSESSDSQNALAAQNMNLLAEVTAENAKTAAEVMRLRILRCLSEISTGRFFKKQIAAVASDRKQAHALLWSSRLGYETSEQAMEAQIAATHRKLSGTELEIERLKQQLETEKLGNNQLVHWKAKNLKTVDGLLQQLKRFTHLDDANITELLEKLADRHAELDVLREEGDEFDRVLQQQVRNPMNQVDNLRERIIGTRSAKSRIARSLKDTEKEEPTPEFDIAKLRNQNAKLKRSNQLLETEISDLEAQKAAKCLDVKSFMEQVVVPPIHVVRSPTRSRGAIIKPNLPAKSAAILSSLG
jgi:hypothetical protein